MFIVILLVGITIIAVSFLASSAFSTQALSSSLVGRHQTTSKSVKNEKAQTINGSRSSSAFMKNSGENVLKLSRSGKGGS